MYYLTLNAWLLQWIMIIADEDWRRIWAVRFSDYHIILSARYFFLHKQRGQRLRLNITLMDGVHANHWACHSIRFTAEDWRIWQVNLRCNAFWWFGSHETLGFNTVYPDFFLHNSWGRLRRKLVVKINMSKSDGLDSCEPWTRQPMKWFVTIRRMWGCL